MSALQDMKVLSLHLVKEDTNIITKKTIKFKTILKVIKRNNILCLHQKGQR